MSTVEILALVVGVIVLLNVVWIWAPRFRPSEDRFWEGHQTEWTDELARRREMRERAEGRLKRGDTVPSKGRIGGERL